MLKTTIRILALLEDEAEGPADAGSKLISITSAPITPIDLDALVKDIIDWVPEDHADVYRRDLRGKLKDLVLAHLKGEAGQ